MAKADLMKRLITLSMAMVLTTVAFAQTGTAQSGAAQTEAPKPKPLAILQGTRVLTSADGEDLTGGPEVALTFTEDKYVQTVNGDTPYSRAVVG